MDPASESPSGKSLNKDVKFDGLFHEWEMKQLKPVNKDLKFHRCDCWRRIRQSTRVNRTTLNFFWTKWKQDLNYCIDNNSLDIYKTRHWDKIRFTEICLFKFECWRQQNIPIQEKSADTSSKTKESILMSKLERVTDNACRFIYYGRFEAIKYQNYGASGLFYSLVKGFRNWIFSWWKCMDPYCGNLDREPRWNRLCELSWYSCKDQNDLLDRWQRQLNQNRINKEMTYKSPARLAKARSGW
jgi:hypothetical protein